MTGWWSLTHFDIALKHSTFNGGIYIVGSDSLDPSFGVCFADDAVMLIQPLMKK